MAQMGMMTKLNARHNLEPDLGPANDMKGPNDKI